MLNARTLLRELVVQPLEGRIGPSDSGCLTESAVLSAVRRLDLAGTHFDHWDLLRAIESFLKIQIEVQPLCLNGYHPLLERQTRRSGIQAELVCLTSAGTLYIFVPIGVHHNLPKGSWKDVILHELSHLMLCQPIPLRRDLTSTERIDGFWHPPRAILRRTPPFDLDTCLTDSAVRRRFLMWCEQEADDCTNHLRSISARGPSSYNRNGSLLGKF